MAARMLTPTFALPLTQAAPGSSSTSSRGRHGDKHKVDPQQQSPKMGRRAPHVLDNEADERFRARAGSLPSRLVSWLSDSVSNVVSSRTACHILTDVYLPATCLSFIVRSDQSCLAGTGLETETAQARRSRTTI